MKVETPQIIWHSKDSKFADRVYSLDFQPGSSRLATAGADEFIHIWEIIRDSEWKLRILSRLIGHEKEVNCVRFSLSGHFLASGGQDNSLCIWKPTNEKPQMAFGHNTEDIMGFPEYWKRITLMRCMAPVISLSWSPDECKIAVGTEDDRVSIWDIHTGKILRQLDGHNHIVMGISWDPKDQFIASQSSDQTVRLWKCKTPKLKRKSQNQVVIPSNEESKENIIENKNKDIEYKDEISNNDINISSNLQSSKLSNIKTWKLFQTIKYEFSEISKAKQINTEDNAIIGDVAIVNHSKISSSNIRRRCLFLAESATTTFFRRLDWSPNGDLLAVPTGQYSINEACNNNSLCVPVSYIFIRNEYSYPAVVLPSPDGPTAAIRFNPVTFAPLPEHCNEMNDKKFQSFFITKRKTAPENPQSWYISNNKKSSDFISTSNDLTPRYIFAIVTLAGTIYIYDTQHIHPLVAIRGLHFQGMNDISWSSDGHSLAVASSDGYITIVFFEDGELGEVILPSNIPNHSNLEKSIIYLESKSINKNKEDNPESLHFQNGHTNESVNIDDAIYMKPKRRIAPTILASYDHEITE
ncbi:putative chromatin assembly factor 1, subunit B [Cryptosporidium serpentis]